MMPSTKLALLALLALLAPLSSAAAKKGPKKNHNSVELVVGTICDNPLGIHFTLYYPPYQQNTCWSNIESALNGGGQTMKCTNGKVSVEYFPQDQCQGTPKTAKDGECMPGFGEDSIFPAKYSCVKYATSDLVITKSAYSGSCASPGQPLWDFTSPVNTCIPAFFYLNQPSSYYVSRTPDNSLIMVTAWGTDAACGANGGHGVEMTFKNPAPGKALCVDMTMPEAVPFLLSITNTTYSQSIKPYAPKAMLFTIENYA